MTFTSELFFEGDLDLHQHLCIIIFLTVATTWQVEMLGQFDTRGVCVCASAWCIALQ